MEILKPCYYDEFKCIANECEDTCCKGWKVVVDKNSFNKYRKIPGDYGRYVNRHIKRERTLNSDVNYAKIQLIDLGCPFLNEDQLCSLYINLGESYLCNTCKSYPRKTKRYNNRCEREMTVSCPEVARILLANKEGVSFCITDEKISDLDKAYLEEENFDRGLERILWNVRILLIEIAQFRELPLWKRLFFIKLAGDKIHLAISNKKYDEVESVILNIRDKVQDENYINEIDQLKTIPKIKVELINKILEARCMIQELNSVFINFIEEINEININYANNLGEYLENEEAFNKYFSDKEYMLENYVVNIIYSNIMGVLYNRNLAYKVTETIMSYAIIRKMLFARWINKDRKLQEEDIIKAVYSFSRSIEHYPGFINSISRELNEQGYDTLATITVLLK